MRGESMILFTFLILPACSIDGTEDRDHRACDYYYNFKMICVSRAASAFLTYLVVMLGVTQFTSAGAGSVINLADVDCGHQAMKPNPKMKAGRIAGGNEAYRGEFPWMVSIQSTGHSETHFCGGFLITNRYVLSSAHCFQQFSRDRMTVIIGEHEFDVVEDPENAYGVGIEEIIPHPQYRNRNDMQHDIALVKLKKEIQWSKFVQPACLPNPREKIPDGQLTSVAGWGDTKEIPGGSKVLMAVEIPIVSNTVCQEKYKWKGSSKQFCVGQVGKGACTGDSGSPLMMKSNSEDKLTVIGIHAGGDGCGINMRPGIYTSVSPYVDWIKANIRR